jgi:hypothetical protein
MRFSIPSSEDQAWINRQIRLERNAAARTEDVLSRLRTMSHNLAALQGTGTYEEIQRALRQENAAVQALLHAYNGKWGGPRYIERSPGTPAEDGAGIFPERVELSQEQLQETVNSSEGSLEHALALLFIRLGPPPEPTEVDYVPVSNGGGGAQQ